MVKRTKRRRDIANKPARQTPKVGGLGQVNAPIRHICSSSMHLRLLFRFRREHPLDQLPGPPSLVSEAASPASIPCQPRSSLSVMMWAWRVMLSHV